MPFRRRKVEHLNRMRDDMDKTNLVVILGDQLSTDISSLGLADKDRDHVLMVEVDAETRYVKHHKKKIAFILSAMRHFAQSLRENGWNVRYVELDDPDNVGNFTSEIERAVQNVCPDQIVITDPGEWRVLEMVRSWSSRFKLPVHILEDRRFLCSLSEFQSWAEGRKNPRMENFYREMRKKTGLLMDGDAPLGGKWNFDHENRKSAKGLHNWPTPFQIAPDEITRDVLELVEDRFAHHFGDLTPFWFGVTPEAAEQALEHFIDRALPGFGDFQDAMLHAEKFLYHSLLSLYMNVGLLHPLKVCKAVEQAYKSGKVPLNSAEGYIRQIIGWREYVRGIYWRHMPDYLNRNYFEARRSLPDFYWTADTPMACLKSAIEQTREEAYAHHIQRLMVTGNFALLAGLDPHEVHEWYLAVYADAFEWVELPNTLGMSQFADGGLLASKPYAASGNYINKMSDYCRNCQFDVKQKTGDDACPFNYLYWDFLDRNRDKLGNNHRLSYSYRTWDKMSESKQQDVRSSAQKFLKAL